MFKQLKSACNNGMVNKSSKELVCLLYILKRRNQWSTQANSHLKKSYKAKVTNMLSKIEIKNESLDIFI